MLEPTVDLQLLAFIMFASLVAMVPSMASIMILTAGTHFIYLHVLIQAVSSIPIYSIALTQQRSTDYCGK